MLLRTPKERALAELGERCRELADFFRDAAQPACPDALRELLASLADAHDAAAADVEAGIRAQGDLPRMPDPEREALAGMTERIKGLFAPDQRDALLEARMRDEMRLLDAANEALAQGLDDATQASVAQVRTLARRTLDRLVAERAAGGR